MSILITAASQTSVGSILSTGLSKVSKPFPLPAVFIPSADASCILVRSWWYRRKHDSGFTCLPFHQTSVLNPKLGRNKMCVTRDFPHFINFVVCFTWRRWKSLFLNSLHILYVMQFYSYVNNNVVHIELTFLAYFLLFYYNVQNNY